MGFTLKKIGFYSYLIQMFIMVESVIVPGLISLTNERASCTEASMTLSLVINIRDIRGHDLKITSSQGLDKKDTLIDRN